LTKLLELYIKLVGLILLGFILGRKLPATSGSTLGKFLFWVGGPISVVGFLHKADLSAQVWIAPAIAYLAIFLGAGLAWLKIKSETHFTSSIPQKPTQGSLILAAMLGNTGYLGFPVTLALVGKEYFAWALFYDLLGSLLGSYGLGIGLAAYFGDSIQSNQQIFRALIMNPGWWSFGFGLLFRQVHLSSVGESGLEIAAWMAIALSLILIGIRLSSLKSLHNLPQASGSLAIKMLIVPLILGSCLHFFGITGSAAKVMILQMAMPPAFSTLIICEIFHLDRDLTVTALALGVFILLLTLPFWLWLF